MIPVPPLIQVKGLYKTFKLNAGPFRPKVDLKALQDVNLEIKRGETLALVGESGCGKSTLGRCLLKLLPIDSGQILFDGQDISGFGARQMKPFRRRMQIIFQDPYSSLNPRLTVEQMLEEPLIIHHLRPTATARRERVRELLHLVGLTGDACDRYPHEFSGGQRQRLGIARALAVEPEFIVCDEAVSALDVSIQAQILKLLWDLQSMLGLTYLFISHDLRVVKLLAHRVAVMYLGKIVELTDNRALYARPSHPYTQALLSAVPRVGNFDRSQRQRLTGEPPRPTNPPSGCHFHPRCPVAESRCQAEVPVLEGLSKPSHQVACFVAMDKEKDPSKSSVPSVVA